jgi:hypothetical protein
MTWHYPHAPVWSIYPYLSSLNNLHISGSIHLSMNPAVLGRAGKAGGGGVAWPPRPAGAARRARAGLGLARFKPSNTAPDPEERGMAEHQLSQKGGADEAQQKGALPAVGARAETWWQELPTSRSSGSRDLAAALPEAVGAAAAAAMGQQAPGGAAAPAAKEGGQGNAAAAPSRTAPQELAACSDRAGGWRSSDHVNASPDPSLLLASGLITPADVFYGGWQIGRTSTHLYTRLQ